jgi:hypothetical protein
LGDTVLITRHSPEQIEIVGHNTGFEAGIATKLIKKVAVSSSISFEKRWTISRIIFFRPQGDNATNYTLSFGKLMYPYTIISKQILT